MSEGKMLKTLVGKYVRPRTEAAQEAAGTGNARREFRRTDTIQTLISIGSLTVFYFSAEPVMKLIGNPDLYSEANLKHRKQEVLDFIRYGLFVDPEIPLS